MLNTAELYYFSPTGGTRRAGEILCEGISAHVEMVDLGDRDGALKQPEGEVIVFAAPVFGGRIPAIVAEKLGKLDGAGKRAVTLVVYGNRAYEDALLELNDILEGRGFQVVASAALVAQHSMAPEVGKGRPDARDRAEILDFAGRILAKLEKGELDPVKVPGNRPYKDGMRMPVAPLTLPACVQCGKCASVCPAGAVRLEGGAVVTDAEACILCMACVAACPERARILPPPLQQRMEQMLGALKSVRRDNEFFL